MKRYLNTKLNGTTETIDQLDSADFASSKEFKAERVRLLNEYSRVGGFGNMYWSQRKCK